MTCTASNANNISNCPSAERSSGAPAMHSYIDTFRAFTASAGNTNEMVSSSGPSGNNNSGRSNTNNVFVDSITGTPDCPGHEVLGGQGRAPAPRCGLRLPQQDPPPCVQAARPDCGAPQQALSTAAAANVPLHGDGGGLADNRGRQQQQQQQQQQGAGGGGGGCNDGSGGSSSTRLLKVSAELQRTRK